MIVTALQTKILVAYVGVLLLANLLGGIVTVILESGHVSSTTDSVSVILTDRQLVSLTERTNALLNTTEAFFHQLIKDVDYQHEYALSIFDGSFPVPILSFYDNNYILDTAPPESEWNYESFWYKNSDLSNNANLNESSLLDNSHGPIFRANSAYAGVYMGFEDGLWRHFPYLDGVGTNLQSMQYICVDTGLLVTGFDPRCRDWYVIAENNRLSTQFTSPYEDASTGDILISAARAVEVSSSLVGVVAADITLSSISAVILSATVLQNGYSYLCDGDKKLIVHPLLEGLTPGIFTIDQVEFTQGTTSEISAFNTLLDDQIFEGVKGQSLFVKDGEEWFVTYGPVPGTPFYLLMVVPASDVVEPAVEVEAYGETSVTSLIVIVVVIVVVTFVLGAYSAHHLSKMITGPVIVFTKVLSDIADMRVEDEKELGGSPDDFDEVDDLRDKISNLFTAIKFSTDAYYKSDYAMALNFLQQVEEMFLVVDQKRALGVVYNNRGNILRKHCGDADNYASALVYLEKAIKLIEGYCEQANSDLAKMREANDNTACDNLRTSLRVFEGILASRQSNRGDCLRVARRFLEADAALKTAYQLYDKLEDFQGMLQVKGNIGLLKLDRDDVTGAEAQFTEALAMADARFKTDVCYASTAGVQFAAMNMGLFYYKVAKRNPHGSPQRHIMVEKALSFFYYSLTVCDRVHRTVQVTCLFTLVDIYKSEYGEAGRAAIATLAQMYPDYVNEIMGASGATNINFLIDVSASMWGSRIKATARVLFDLVNTKMQAGDTISMDMFAKDLNVVVAPTTLTASNKDAVNASISSLIPACTVGRTHCYKALLEMGQKLIAQSSKGPHYIVMLTDGEDNGHNITPEAVKKYYTDHDIKLIVVSVAVDEPEVISTLRYLASNAEFYVKASGDPASITGALKQGFDIAVNAGNVVMESL